MKFIDMHCDTLMYAATNGVTDLLEIQDSMLDIKRMKASGASTEFFAIFFPPLEDGSFKLAGRTFCDEEYFYLLYKCYKNTMQRGKEIVAEAMNADDIVRNELAGKMSGILTLEDGRMIDGSFEKLQQFYDLGIRLITLTWNQANCFGFPNSTDAAIMNKGLTPFGKDAIKYMNDLGIIIDVSHLSDGGFWDVVEISKKPFVASHSNCRDISPHQRNLTDEMLKILAEKGGVAGINFAAMFLNGDITVEDSTVELLSLHLQRMINIGGEDLPALGSDLDGIGGNLEIDCILKMSMLFERLKRDGISERVIEKIAYKNALRVINETMQ